MNYIIMDLEATCWEEGSTPHRMETIEIGAVKLLAPSLEAVGEYSTFVKPLQEPILSEFCQNLTHIAQKDVDEAKDFKTVFPKFISWISHERFTLCSWSTYDLEQLKADCRRNGIKFPDTFNNHIDLRERFAVQRGIKPVDTNEALNLIDLQWEGRRHRALDDSRNISRIARTLLS